MTANDSMLVADHQCAKCGSTRVAWFRLDQDWGTAGDLTRLNDDAFYDEGDPEERNDIDLEGGFCFACRGFYS